MFAAVFAVISALAYLVFGAVLETLMVLALLFLLLALLAPSILMPLNRLWRLLAMRLGVVNNFLLLGIFFVVVMMPVSAAMRLFGRDPMRRSIDRDSPSYWTPVGRQTTAQTFPDMF
ncbi:MAG: SxtJ family membrane protein [Hyphomicrobiales bacterium]|nr:SxtJ family membrane protein [Hyphomicrobiales bacterium]